MNKFLKSDIVTSFAPARLFCNSDVYSGITGLDMGSGDTYSTQYDSGFTAHVPGPGLVNSGSDATGSGLFSAISSALNAAPSIIKAISTPTPSPTTAAQYAAAGYTYNAATGTWVPSATTGLQISGSVMLVVGLGVAALLVVYLMSKK